MASTTRTYWLHALTGVHIGAGVGVGAVDLPVVRERITEWPYVPGTSVKGVVAARHGATDEERKRKERQDLRAVFGYADNEETAGSNAGALAFTDARLVCLPVASFFGTFAWTTSRMALRRLARDLKAAKHDAAEVDSGERAEIPEGGSALTDASQPDQVFLGDLDFKVTKSAMATKWAKAIGGHVFADDAAWAGEFEKRFVILPDDQFNHLARWGCEVVPRIKINPKTRSAQGGALWLEEMIPAESILAGLILCERIYLKDAGLDPASVMSKYCSVAEVLQFGGKASVGRGRVQVRFSAAPDGGIRR